jgi:hypothetical protein
MRFFIPAAKDAEQETSVYGSIKQFLGQELGAAFSDRKIRRLCWHHEGKRHEAEVGKESNANGETVIAILFEPFRNLYHVCTPNSGVLRGMSILAGASSVSESSDFDEESDGNG